MKTVVLLFFTLLNTHVNGYANKAEVITRLIPIKAEITEALDKVDLDTDGLDREGYFYFLNITAGDAYTIEVAVVPINNSAALLYGRNYIIQGYFKHNNITVIVFGTTDGQFFTETEETINLLLSKEISSPAALPGIKPVVDVYAWTFVYKDDALTFKGVGFADFFVKKE